ncbi:flagellar export chaperone FliS [Brevibacillus thermoruber]|uniref:Flagellar export chaperone FliS n=1 Tax=Brevibacillus thermoruber TaxID=33942 RepID=A0A9X3TQA7_9BACL|nr:flagellar export chaperone FliS [Brevibacillus thermoruber]MDA5108068.1 flagellar export chaperone FliS [Brevibacillus thermoruber]
MLQNAVQTYQTNQVTTATPAELTLMLYNGALKFLKQARIGLQKKDYESANNYCLRVQDILKELMATLNDSYPISKQFFGMYEYMLRRLIEGNIRKDIHAIEEVEDLFTQFRDTWKEAMLLAKQQG